MAEVNSVNKCSNTKEYLDFFLGKQADKVLANPDVKYFLKEAKAGRSFITFHGMRSLADVKIKKIHRKRFRAILLRKIKDPALRKVLTPPLHKLSEADLEFLTAPNILQAVEVKMRREVEGKINALVKAGKFVSLLDIVKQRIKVLRDDVNLNSNRTRRRYIDLVKHLKMKSGKRYFLLATLAIFALGKFKYRRAAATLIKIVKLEKDSRIRRQAIIALGKIADKKAVPLLLSIVDKSYINYDDVVGGIRAFGGYSAFSHQVGAMIGLYFATTKVQRRKIESALTKKLAITALARIGDKRAIPILTKIVERDRLQGIAHVALAALSEFPSVVLEKRAAFKRLLVKLIKRNDFRLRGAAVMLLATLGDKRAVPGMIQMLSEYNFNNPDLDPARNISKLIRNDPSLVSGKFASLSLAQNIYNGLLLRYNRAKMPIVQLVIIGTLARLKDPQTIFPLMLLAKREPKLRAPIIFALNKIVNSKTLPALLATLDQRFTLNEFKNKTAIKSLCQAIDIHALKSPNNTLARLNELLQTPNLYSILKKKGKNIPLSIEIRVLLKMTKSFRRVWDKSMGIFRLPKFSKLTRPQKYMIVLLNRKLLEAAYASVPKSKKDKIMRRFALFLLSRINNDLRVVYPIVNTLYDPDPLVEREAIAALTKLSKLPTVNKEFFVKTLIRKYRNKGTDYIPRRIILVALKTIGSKSAIPFLTSITKNGDHQLRRIAADAVRHLKVNGEARVASQK
jgi:HEAT repeat protein